MLKHLEQRRRDDEGFTLIELMVVVLILGILMAIAIPTFLSSTNSAKESAAESNAVNAFTNEMSNWSSQNAFLTSADGPTLDPQLSWGTGSGKVAAEVSAAGASLSWQTSSTSTGPVVYIAALAADNTCYQIISDQQPSSGNPYTGYMVTTGGCLATIPAADVSPTSGNANTAANREPAATATTWYTSF